MRFIISKSFITSVPNRQAFIFETMHLWTNRLWPEDGFIILESIPTNCLDIAFILGHDTEVKSYLINHSSFISESIIVIISCLSSQESIWAKLPNKHIYLSFNDPIKGAEFYNGEQFGFNFDITKSEIMFYNCSQTYETEICLAKSFIKIR